MGKRYRFGAALVHAIGLAIYVLGLSAAAWAGNPQIFGTVSDNQQTPLEGVTVEAFVVGTTTLVVDTATNAEGNYSLEVPAGTYDISYTPTPNSGFQDVLLSDVEVFANLQQDVILVPLDLAEVQFLLQDRDGVPAVNQEIRLTHDATGARLTQRTDAAGRFSANVRVGTHTIRLRSGSGAGADIPRNFDLDGSLEITGDLDQTLVLPNVNLNATVLDSAGDPVADAVVDNFPGCITEFELLAGVFLDGRVWDAGQTTDAAGQATLATFPCQSFLRATPTVASGLPQFVVPDVDIFADTAVTLQLPEPVIFSGILQDRDGNPAYDDRIRLIDDRLTTRRTAGIGDGLFSFPMVSGAYQIRIDGWAFASQPAQLPRTFRLQTEEQALELLADREEPLTLPNILLDVTVVDSSNTSVPDAAVSVQCLQSVSFDLLPGVPTAVSLLREDEVTDLAGQARLAFFPCLNANLSVVPAAGSGLPAQSLADLELLSDQALTVELTTPSVFEGALTDRFGTPEPGQRMILTAEPSGIRVFDQDTDATGAFSATVAPGFYELRLRRTAPEPRTSLIPNSLDVQTAAALDLTSDLTQDLELPGLLLDVTVVDPNGAPIPETSVRVLSNLPTAFEIFPGVQMIGLQNSSEVTDAEGFARLVFLPFNPPDRQILLQVTPPPDSGFAAEAVSGVTVENDTTLLVVLQFVNQVPVADAGPAQTVEATSPSGAVVALDGSGSSDPDGDPLTYEWTEDGTEIATGAIANVPLALGPHLITLTVRDPEDASDSDEVQIDVVDTTPPDTAIVSATDDDGVSIADGDTTSSTSIVFELAGDDLVGVDGFECSVTGGSFSPCTSPVTLTGLADGDYVFAARAFDASGNVDPTPVTFAWTVTTVALGPILSIDERIPAAESEPVDVDVELTTNGATVAATTFSVDYDETCLAFDDTDANPADGIPDAITFHVVADFAVTVFHDSGDTDGELDISIADVAPPVALLGDGALLTVTFTATCSPDLGSTVIAPVVFSGDPEATFSDDLAVDVEGATLDGSVEIWSGLRGDCNGNGLLSAADLIADGLEIFDGDGSFWLDVPGSTFAGNPVGCDANADTVVNAGDVSCTILLIFGGTCGGSPLIAPHGEPVLRLGPPRVGEGGSTWWPVMLSAGGHQVSSLAFSLDLSSTFDSVDVNGDGLPDSVRFPHGVPDLAQVRYNDTDRSGELDILLANTDGALSEGVVVEIEIGQALTSELWSQLSAQPRFSNRPEASFGDLLGNSVAGRTIDTARQRP